MPILSKSNHWKWKDIFAIENFLMEWIILFYPYLLFSHWFGKKNLSRTLSAWFSWGSKPDFRSCRMTVSYPSEMFFSFREKCCYMLIFANEYAVLIESFDNRFEATPFYHILYRWRKFFCFVYMYFVRLASSWWVVASGPSKLVKII